MDYSVASQSRLQNNSMTIFTLLLLVTLTKFSIQLGFSLKPYMIYLLLFIMIHVSTFYFQKLQLFEVVLVLFYIMYCYSGVFALYPSSSLRILLGITLYLGCYFIAKSILGYSSQSMIEKAIANVGIIFNTLSLGFYMMGLKAVNFNFQGDRITEYGVLIDREYPRLIGLLQDPNFYIFYNTIFFAYYMCNPNSYKNKLGLVLCIVTSVLTFSRGGLLAIILMFVVYMLLNKPIKQLKIMVGSLVSLLIVTYISVVYWKFDIYGIIGSRIKDFSNDGGSGRFSLWERAWEFFSNNIAFGIGAFNFSDYNFFKYGDTLTVHNTFLDILSESGLVGFTIFLIFVITVMYQLLEHRVHKEKPYLFITFIGFVIQMLSLSVIINDMFFMYLAILATYFNYESNKAKGWKEEK